MLSKGGADFKADVLAATDLVALIAQTVSLKKRGKDYVGLCPFHSEKSPSFKVDSNKQMFYCFGCKAAGDAITFVMKRDRIEFKEALRQLGQEAGLEMPQFGGSKEKTDERKALIEAQSAACGYFEAALRHPEQGAAARAYLEKRGITSQTAQHFRLGLAPDGWDGLMRSQACRKFPPQLLVTGGLLKARENGNGFYDTFRNRLMFPIRDRMGRIIAFGGRAMPGSPDPAKYLNSPETPLFNKSACAYGIDLAAGKIVETGTAVIVEGYTDVVMAHQFGVSNVVSVLGTAMTAQHLEQLRRLAHKIVLLFDADAAGDTAVDRVVELFLTQPIEIAIASMPQGVDPDEYLLAHGAAEFEKVLSSASDVLAFKWKQLSREFASRADDVTGQQQAVDKYLKLLGDARGSGPVDPVRWGSALARVSRLTEMPIDELNARFKARAAPRRRPVQPMRGAATPADGPGLSDTAQSDPSSQLVSRPVVLRAQRTAERWLLGALLIDSQRWEQIQLDVAVEDFADPDCRALAQTFWETKRHEGDVVLNEFLALLTEPAQTQLVVELVEEVEQLAGQSSLDEILGGVVGYWLQQRRRREENKLLGGLRRRTVYREIPAGQAGAETIENSPVSPGQPQADAPASEEGSVSEESDAAELPEQSDADENAAAAMELAAEAHGNEMPPSQADAAAEAASQQLSAEKMGSQQNEQAKLLLFEQLVKKTQSTDLRRLGPVRRSRS